jgi:hypothetical protein
MLAQQLALAFTLAFQQAPQDAALLVVQEATLIFDLALGNGPQVLAAANDLAGNPLYNMPVGYTLALLEGELLLSAAGGLNAGGA